MSEPTAPDGTGLRELAGLFLKLGTTAFGGPAVHIAMMEEEVVRRRGWMSESKFLDLLAATNLIPGPNSTEMAIHVGYERAGWRGLVVAGTCFIAPAMLIVGCIAELYVRFGSLPETGWLLYGVKPVLIAIIAQAVWSLGKSTLKAAPLRIVAAAAFGLALYGLNELAILFGMGGAMLLGEIVREHREGKPGGLPALVPWFVPSAFTVTATAVTATTAATVFTTGGLFWFFFKVGSVLYGSGYVLIAFIQNGLVEHLGWLTKGELLDAVAVGQITPGPLFTTATFIGYMLGARHGTGGPLTGFLATLGIFLPAFIFVAITGPYVYRLRKSAYTGAVLDGIVAASLALMAAAVVALTRTAVTDVPTAVIAGVSAVLLVRYKLNSTWLVLGTAPLGWALHLLGYI